MNNKKMKKDTEIGLQKVLQKIHFLDKIAKRIHKDEYVSLKFAGAEALDPRNKIGHLEVGRTSDGAWFENYTLEWSITDKEIVAQIESFLPKIAETLKREAKFFSNTHVNLIDEILSVGCVDMTLAYKG